jgi:hypothetical protein
MKTVCTSTEPITDSRCRALWLLVAVALGGMGGCAMDPRLSTQTVYLGNASSRTTEADRMNYDNVSYWEGDGVPGEARIRIDLGEQRAYFYKGDQLVGVSILSTGREGFETPNGNFKVIQKSKDHKSSKYGNYVDAAGNIVMRDIDRTKDKQPPGTIYDGASMPYFMRIQGGVGMHAGFLPGYPASHGCIRMPGFMAEAFFNNVEIGTPVVVTH